MNLSSIKEWVKDRFAEKTTIDGIVFVGFGIAVITLQSVVSVIGALAIVYGAYRVMSKE